MSLSCNCDWDEFDDAAWYFSPDDFFKPLEGVKRSRKCKSCGVRLKLGAEVLEFFRTRGPKDDIEARIYGEGRDSVPLASWWFCTRCGEIYLNLREYGYCVPPDDCMSDLLEEHKELERERICNLTRKGEQS